MSEHQLKRIELEKVKIQAELELVQKTIKSSDACADLQQAVLKVPEPLFNLLRINPHLPPERKCCCCCLIL